MGLKVLGVPLQDDYSLEPHKHQEEICQNRFNQFLRGSYLPCLHLYCRVDPSDNVDHQRDTESGYLTKVWFTNVQIVIVYRLNKNCIIAANDKAVIYLIGGENVAVADRYY